MDIIIGDKIAKDLHITKSLENIMYNTLQKGIFEIYWKGNNIIVNIQNTNYIHTDIHTDLIYQIQTTIQDTKYASLIYTHGKHTTIIHT
jgi:hypothetical protein